MHGGKRPGAGRKKGSLNKRKQEIQELLDDMDCDPIEGMARIALEAEATASSAESFQERKDSLTLAGNMYKELAQYVAPKRRAVEMKAEVTEKQFVVSAEPEMSTDEWLQKNK